MIQLRPYQYDLKQSIRSTWDAGHRNVLAVLPTGGGKTVIFSDTMHDHLGMSVAIAHRQELVGQISQSLARMEVRHRIIGPDNVVKMCMANHRAELGKSWYDPNGQHAVAGVDTVLARKKQLAGWLNQVTLWVEDEAHHITRENKWGKVIDLMPHARGLGVTATPIRADGKGLGAHADGVMHAMVEGPSMRWLIDQGFLTDYRIFAPPSDLDMTVMQVSQSTGDFTQQSVKKAVKRSHIVGDVVEHYKRIAYGKLGVTFASDVETAGDIAAQYNAAGVPAAVVDAKTPDRIRQDCVRRLGSRELWQLVNVDLFGEGFDLPAIEVVSMARPTQSYALYSQQFGRALRPMPDKEAAIIIDHVGNVIRHGLPDKERIWSLDGRESVPRMKNPDDDIPLRYCTACTQPYERFRKSCPYCGHVHVPEGRDSIEQVDGDLFELSPAVLEQMRNEAARAMEHPSSVGLRMRRAGASEIAVRSAEKQLRLKQEALVALRESMAWWAGKQLATGLSEQEAHMMFYHRFGVDALSAQTLGRKDAIELAERINGGL